MDFDFNPLDARRRSSCATTAVSALPQQNQKEFMVFSTTIPRRMLAMASFAAAIAAAPLTALAIPASADPATPPAAATEIGQLTPEDCVNPETPERRDECGRAWREQVEHNWDANLSNPDNPNSSLNPHNLNNPNNPQSPLNPSNPANPLSPDYPGNPNNPNNPMNPNNPASPMNPNNRPAP
ncbi:hypothetical protein [Nocardia sp. NPDC057440]|uniref:hypothetical protein n=1 Tax=Nocardia sp. NPDC057440 TaxID=3346134 RepID=UPI00366F96FB